MDLVIKSTLNDFIQVEECGATANDSPSGLLIAGDDKFAFYLVLKSEKMLDGRYVLVQTSEVVKKGKLLFVNLENVIATFEAGG